jgi:hypothetical protein
MHEYLSEYTTLKASPPIDSISWDVRDDGVDIYVNTHDATNNTRYYRWNYIETWQYNTRYRSLVTYDEYYQPIVRRSDEYVDHCWETGYSSQIMLGTSIQLKDDVIRRYKLLSIPKGSVKFAWKYNIVVRQQALTESAYLYWQAVQKTTESLGGLFDPLPSEVIGNIQCITNPAERVIGYWDGGVTSSKMIFINYDEVPADFFRPFNCKVDSISLDELRTTHYEGPVLMPLVDLNNRLTGYTFSSPECSDCNAVLNNATTVKPPFWE